MKTSNLERSVNLIFSCVLGVLIVVAILVTACHDTSKTPTPPKYRFGDRVYIPDGFYQGAKGRVMSVHMWGSDWMCNLDVTYMSVDGKFWKNEQDAQFKCSDLLEDASE